MAYQDILYVKYFSAEATKLNITSYSLEINEGKFTIIPGLILSIKVINKVCNPFDACYF